jgi:hypothetical protein
MKKTVLTFGLISGLIMSAMFAITAPFMDHLTGGRGMIIGYAGMLAGSLLIYFGIRTYRENVAGGTVSFGRAFSIGMLIGLVAAVLYAASWEVMYRNFYPDFMEKYAAAQVESARAKGATQQELDLKAAQMKKAVESYNNPLVRAAYTMVEPLPVALIVSLISATILSRRRRREEPIPVTA